MAAEDAILLRDPHHPLDAGQRLHLLDRQALGVAEQVDLGDGAQLAFDAVNLGFYPGQQPQPLHELGVLGAIGVDLVVQDENHAGNRGFAAA